MIGRGAMGNPWIFQRINGYLNDCIVIPEPSLYEKNEYYAAAYQK